ncbi:MAG: hypothetical protein LBD59_12045 [Prevotellaceae bacterium]|nr:hypothetical protein [Prevotellaceae bacterium]
MIERLGKRTVAVIMLTFLAVYAVNVGFFIHTHVIDGKNIAHSHFYVEKSDTPAHTHTAMQVRTIDFLSCLLMTLVPCLILLMFRQKWRIMNIVHLSKIPKIVLRSYNLRAPPHFD